MDQRPSHELSRRAVACGLALAISAGTFAQAAPALADPGDPPGFDRRAVIKRAEVWTSRGITYSQSRFFRGYRTDCSGFVSMAWGLKGSLVTWTLPHVSRPISKNELKPGDIMLNNSGGRDRHVVIFGGWANRQRSAYVAYEENGTKDRAIKHVVPYPYKSRAGRYKPYRYTGGPYVVPARGPEPLSVRNYRAKAARYRRAKTAKLVRYRRHKAIIEARYRRQKAALARAEEMRRVRYERAKARDRLAREQRYERRRLADKLKRQRYVARKAAAALAELQREQRYERAKLASEFARRDKIRRYERRKAADAAARAERYRRHQAEGL